MSRWTRFARLAVLAGMTWAAPGARAQDDVKTAKTTKAPDPHGTLNLRFTPAQAGAPVDPRFTGLASPVPFQPHQKAFGARAQTSQAWSAALMPGRGPNQFAFVVRDPADATLGATLEPVGDVLRAQLDIPADRGLIVATIQPGGAAHRTGLLDNDILLTLADKPLASPADLTRNLKAVGEHDVVLTLLRAGQTQSLKVRPVSRVTLGPAEAAKTEYFLGVSVNVLDDALRAQLKLGEKSGLVVGEVVNDSPASKAGIKPNDILLALDGQPLDGVPSLAKLVNTLKDKPIQLKLLRGGKVTTVVATPSRRPVPADATREGFRLLMMDNQAALNITPANPVMGRYQLPPSNAVNFVEAPAPRIEALEKEIKALRKSLEEVRDLLKAERSGARGKVEAHGDK